MPEPDHDCSLRHFQRIRVQCGLLPGTVCVIQIAATETDIFVIRALCKRTPDIGGISIVILNSRRYIEENHASKAADMISQRNNSRSNNRGGPSQEMMQYWGKSNSLHLPKALLTDPRLQVRSYHTIEQALGRSITRGNREPRC